MVSRTFKIIKMKKKEKVPFEMLQIALNINKSNLEKIYWMEEFMNYIQMQDKKLYKMGRIYADEQEANDYFTEEDKKIWGIK